MALARPRAHSRWPVVIEAASYHALVLRKWVCVRGRCKWIRLISAIRVIRHMDERPAVHGRAKGVWLIPGHHTWSVPRSCAWGNVRPLVMMPWVRATGGVARVIVLVLQVVKVAGHWPTTVRTVLAPFSRVIVTMEGSGSVSTRRSWCFGCRGSVGTHAAGSWWARLRVSAMPAATASSYAWAGSGVRGVDIVLVEYVPVALVQGLVGVVVATAVGVGKVYASAASVIVVGRGLLLRARRVDDVYTCPTRWAGN